MPATNQARCALKSRCCHRSYEQNAWCGRKYTQGHRCSTCSLTFCTQDCYAVHPCGLVPRRWSKSLANKPYDRTDSCDTLNTEPAVLVPATVVSQPNNPSATDTGPETTSLSFTVPQFQCGVGIYSLTIPLPASNSSSTAASLVEAVEQAIQEAEQFPATFARVQAAALAAVQPLAAKAKLSAELQLHAQGVAGEDSNNLRHGEAAAAAQDGMSGGAGRYAEGVMAAHGGVGRAHGGAGTPAVLAASGHGGDAHGGGGGGARVVKRARRSQASVIAETAAAVAISAATGTPLPQTLPLAAAELTVLRAERRTLELQLEEERSHYKQELYTLQGQLEELQRQLAAEASGMHSMQVALVESIVRTLPDDLLRHAVTRIGDMHSEREAGASVCPFPVMNALVNQRSDHTRQLLETIHGAAAGAGADAQLATTAGVLHGGGRGNDGGGGGSGSSGGGGGDRDGGGGGGAHAGLEERLGSQHAGGHHRQRAGGDAGASGGGDVGLRFSSRALAALAEQAAYMHGGMQNAAAGHLSAHPGVYGGMMAMNGELAPGPLGPTGRLAGSSHGMH